MCLEQEENTRKVSESRSQPRNARAQNEETIFFPAEDSLCDAVMQTHKMRQPTSGGVRARELCESRGGRPGLPVPNSPYGFCGRKATLNEWATQSSGAVFMKAEVAVLGSRPY